jgi:hypothetical protein
MFSRRLFLSLMLVAMPASADLLQVAISGTFDNHVPTTVLMAPNVTWLLTFDVASQATADPGGGANEVGSNLTYVLNNNPVSGAFIDDGPIYFPDAAAGGGVEIVITTSDFSNTAFFGFNGTPQLFSGVSNPEILTGSFDSINGHNLNIGASGPNQPTQSQTAFITITDLSPVPEPHSNILLGTVFVLAGSALLFKRRRGSAAPRERSEG